MPQVAHAEEYDSDVSAVKPGTRVDARASATYGRSSRTPRTGPYATSDSGYSSYTNASNTTGAVVATVGQSKQAVQPTTSSSRSKPVIHRAESQRSQKRPASRSVSTSRPSADCRDPNCRDPTCLSTKNSDRRYTLPHQPTQQPARPLSGVQYPVQQPGPGGQYQIPPDYRYPTAAPPTAAPILNPQPTPRARTGSTPRDRPGSWAGPPYAGPTYGSTPPQGGMQAKRGPPPSPSAYHQQQLQDQYTAAYHRAIAEAQLASTPLATAMGTYAPAQMQPPSPQRPALPHPYSARAGIAAPGYATGILPTTREQVPAATYSARRASMMPGSFPNDYAIHDSASSSDSSSQSDSASDSEDSDYKRKLRHAIDKEKRKRDSRLMPPPSTSRRPSFRTTHSTPAISTRSSREPLRRSSRSEVDFDHPSSSDYVDSDRTTRPVVDKRLSYTSTQSSRSARQPSVSTTSSGGRTRATTDTSVSGSGRYIVEDSRGRRTVYPSREEAERIARHLKKTTLEDDVEAYQTRVRGGLSPELTAENIKRSQQPPSRRPSSSRASASSRKSGQSKTSKSNVPAGFQIRSGGTVLHFTGDAKIEMRQGEDGEQMMIIGSGSSSARGEGSHYRYGSSAAGKSEGSSRVGRSRAGSKLGRRDTIHEEDGNEVGV
nr:hypothetical protein B0A51_17207 [Rachicladosporium sp. CCFEE 5018]